MNIPLFFTFAHIQGRPLMRFLIWQKLLCLLCDEHRLREVFETLHGYIFALGLVIPGLMTLCLFQGHRYARIINCKLFFRFLSTVFRWCGVGTHVNKIMDSMLCVPGVHLRDIANTFSLYLNVSHPSICFCWCCWLCWGAWFFVCDTYQLVGPVQACA